MTYNYPTWNKEKPCLRTRYGEYQISILTETKSKGKISQFAHEFFSYFDTDFSCFFSLRDRCMRKYFVFFVPITLTSTPIAFSRAVQFHYVMSMKLSLTLYDIKLHIKLRHVYIRVCIHAHASPRWLFSQIKLWNSSRH